MAAVKKKYKVLAGRHVENGVRFYKGGPNGDIFESDKNILKFNVRGFPPKFALVSALVDEATTSQGEPEIDPEQSSADLDKDLVAMTIDELKAFAAEGEIDIKGLTKKDDIIRRIQEKVNA